MLHNVILTVEYLFRIHNMPGTVIMVQTFIILCGLKSTFTLYCLMWSSQTPLMEGRTEITMPIWQVEKWKVREIKWPASFLKLCKSEGKFDHRLLDLWTCVLSAWVDSDVTRSLFSRWWPSKTTLKAFGTARWIHFYLKRLPCAQLTKDLLTRRSVSPGH